MGDDGLPPPSATSRAPSTGGTSARSGTSARGGGGGMKRDGPPVPELPKIYTRKHVYPIAVEAPMPRPMSATQAARVDRVRAKKAMLGAQFLGRPGEGPGEKPAKQELPPWWSNERHGLPASALALPSKDLTTVVPLEGIRRTLQELRDSLGALKWPGDPPRAVSGPEDRERRVRAEVADMELWMRNHLGRMARREYERTHAPAKSDKHILLVAFQRQDTARSGDVTVAEFAELWNGSLHLLVPVQKFDAVEHQMVDVRVRGDVDVLMAVERWKLNKCSWSAKQPQFTELEASPEDIKRQNWRLLLRPKRVLEAHAAALFLKYGYDSDGLMPYEVFVNALFTPSARLLGMQRILDQRSLDKHGFGAGDDAKFDGKILYAKAKAGVFPPSDFDPECVERSNKAPSASLVLEHVYGYDGRNNLSGNLFFTDNPEEIVYYAAGVGVVHNVALDTQRFFFGHTNDIYCITQHPCSWVVATGQQKATGAENNPYCCVWETRGCKQLQRLEHPQNTRGVVAMSFSACGKRLLTVTCDNGHSIFLWDWMKDAKKLAVLSGTAPEPVLGWPVEVPCASYGPAGKQSDLRNSDTGFFYKKPFNYVPDGELKLRGDNPKDWKEGDRRGGPARSGALYADPDAAESAADGMEADQAPDNSSDPEAWMQGADFALDCHDAGKPRVFSASNGSPPQVYGAEWNPYSDGSEFLTYGVKHIKFWSLNPENGLWESVSGQFGPKTAEKNWVVDNVLSAVWIPDPMGPYRKTRFDKDTRKPLYTKAAALVTRTGKVIEQLYDEHGADELKLYGQRYTGDDDLEACTSAIVATGFVCGDIGIWMRVEEPLPASGKPTKAPGWALARVVKAHKPGPQMVMRDGSVTCMGVRDLALTADRKTLLSAGADGCVMAWDVRQTVDDQPQYFRRRGDEHDTCEPQLMPPNPKPRGYGTATAESIRAASAAAMVRFARLPQQWSLKSPYPGRPAPCLRAVTSRPGSQEFVVGTFDCDIWMLSPGADARPRQLVAGNSGELHGLATHPTDSHVFATACDSGDVMLWDAHARALIRATAVGFPARAAAFSMCGQHLAVGGQTGRLRVLKSDTLQPLVTFANCRDGITVIRYSPSNAVMAVGSHDLVVQLYDTGFRGRPEEGQKTGPTLQYSPIDGVINDNWDEDNGGTGTYVLLAKCEGHSATIKHLDFSLPLWNPPELRGRTVLQTQCAGHELLYFDAGGLGQARTGKQELANMRNTKFATRTTTLGFDVMGIWPDGSMAVEVDSLARSTSQEYCATGDHFSTVKLFNYPCVYDDAPWREYKGHASYVTCVRWAADDRLLFSAGGGDRCLFQWRAVGVAKEDALPKGLAVPVPGVHGPPLELRPRRKEAPWCDVEQCTFCNRKELPPPPPPLWGPLDEAGKTWGSITYNARSGACSCKNCPLRLRQELRAFDRTGTGAVTPTELGLALRAFGEPPVGKDRIAELLLGSTKKAGKAAPAEDAEDGAGGEDRYVYEPFVALWMADVQRRVQEFALNQAVHAEDDD